MTSRLILHIPESPSGNEALSTTTLAVVGSGDLFSPSADDEPGLPYEQRIVAMRIYPSHAYMSWSVRGQNQSGYQQLEGDKLCLLK